MHKPNSITLLFFTVVATVLLFTYTGAKAAGNCGLDAEGNPICWNFDLGFRLEFLGFTDVGNVTKANYSVSKTGKNNFNIIWFAVPIGTSLTPIILLPAEGNPSQTFQPCSGDTTGAGNSAGAGDCEHSWWRFSPDPAGQTPITVAARSPVRFRTNMVLIKSGSNLEFGAIKGIAAPLPVGAVASTECKTLSANTSMFIQRDPTNFCAVPTTVQFFASPDCSGDGSFGQVSTPSNLVYCTSGGGNALCNECIQVTHASPDCVDYVSGGFLITFCF